MSLAHSLEGEIDKMMACVHCGMCLQACPTYVRLGDENHGPRGRAYLMRGVAEHRLSIDDSFINHMEMCLQCRACEVACPSGVNYGHIMEAARAEIASSPIGNTLDRRLRRFMLNRVLTSKFALKIAFATTHLLQCTGLARKLISLGIFKGSRFNVEAGLALLLPEYKSTAEQIDYNSIPNQKKQRVAFFEGCVMPGMFGHINNATKRVLAANQCEIVSPVKQGCCGALHTHAGELEMAQALARRNIEAFEASGAAAIIINAAGCGAALKEYDKLLEQDSSYKERAREFSSRVKDISEYLVEIGFRRSTAPVTNDTAKVTRVTYDAPCHLIYVQKVTTAPLEIIKSIPDVEFVAQQDADVCCGGAGTYNLTQPEMSQRLQADKVRHIVATGAEVLATGNPGCQMQLASGLYKAGYKEVQVVHPIELLDKAYAASGFYVAPI